MTSSRSPSEKAFRIVESMAPRTEGVVESLCCWQPGRRPAGAPPLVRLSVEEEPPTCYPWLLPGEIRDVERRTFNPYRAVRRGLLDERPYSLQPDLGGVRADELLERLGTGEVDFGLLVHVAHQLAEQVLLLQGSVYQLPHLGEQWPADGLNLGAVRHRTQMMARPVIGNAHFTFGFDGDVSLDVVTDSWSNARGTPPDEREPRLAPAQFETELRHWVWGANFRIEHLIRDLAGPKMNIAPLCGVVDEAGLNALGTLPMLPSGRRALVDMLAALFPERRRRWRDLVDSP